MFHEIGLLRTSKRMKKNRQLDTTFWFFDLKFFWHGLFVAFESSKFVSDPPNTVVVGIRSVFLMIKASLSIWSSLFYVWLVLTTMGLYFVILLILCWVGLIYFFIINLTTNIQEFVVHLWALIGSKKSFYKIKQVC